MTCWRMRVARGWAGGLCLKVWKGPPVSTNCLPDTSRTPVQAPIGIKPDRPVRRGVGRRSISGAHGEADLHLALPGPARGLRCKIRPHGDLKVLSDMISTDRHNAARLPRKRQLGRRGQGLGRGALDDDLGPASAGQPDALGPARIHPGGHGRIRRPDRRRRT